jgi:hypothetical protein
MSGNSIQYVASTTKKVRETWFSSDDDVSHPLAEMAKKIEEIAPGAAEAINAWSDEGGTDDLEAEAVYTAVNPLATLIFKWLDKILKFVEKHCRSLCHKAGAMASAADKASRVAVKAVTAAEAVQAATEDLALANALVMASAANSRDARNAKRAADRASNALMRAVGDAVDAAREAASTAAKVKEETGFVTTLADQLKNLIQPSRAVAAMYMHVELHAKRVLENFDRRTT